MSMKPILFNTEMVRAILEGRKTQTRRAIKPQPSSGLRESPFIKSGVEDGHGRKINVPFYPGDILWVRETWARISDWADVDPDVGLFDGYIYKADWNTTEHPNWHPSIHMPREAARLFLTVKDVRVERLQDISDHDCWAEGVVTDPFDYQIPEYYERYPGESFSRSCFLGLWDSIYNKKHPWGSNPWVWVIEFERQENAI